MAVWVLTCSSGGKALAQSLALRHCPWWFSLAFIAVSYSGGVQWYSVMRTEKLVQALLPPEKVCSGRIFCGFFLLCKD